MIDKLKQLSKDTAVYGISTMLGRFLNFLLVPLYTNVFTTSEYGIVTNIYAYIALLNVAYIYGMDAAYLKFASTLEIGDDKDNFSTPFYTVTISSLIFSFFFLVFRSPLQSAFSIPAAHSHLLDYMLIILMLDALAIIPFVKLRLLRQGKKFALYKLLNIVFTVVLNLVLVLKLKWGIEAVFISNLLASLLSLILVMPVIFKSLKFSFNKTLFSRLLKFGLPYFPAGLSAMLIQVIDRPILESLTDLGTLGIYQANYRLGIFMMLFVTMFQYAWQPFFLEEAKHGDPKPLFAKVLTYFTLAGSFILVVLSLFVGDIVSIEIMGRTIIGRAFLTGLYIVPVVLLGYMFNGMYVIFTAGIFIKEKSMYVPFITGLGALVNIGVNYLLIPSWGIMGAAFATFAAYFAMAAGLYIVTQKFYKIEYEYGRIVKIFLCIAVTGAVYYMLLFSNSLLFVYKIGLLVLFSVMIYIFAVDKEEIKFIKKKLLRI